MLTREETIKIFEICHCGAGDCDDCPMHTMECKGVEELSSAVLHYLRSDKSDKENEPAPTAIGTSSEVSKDTGSILQFDDSTKERICQEVENARCRLVQAYDEDLESDLGIRLYGEAMGLLEAMIHRLKGGDGNDNR